MFEAPQKNKMSPENLAILQQKVDLLKVPFFEKLHINNNVPADFRPWENSISPSALYDCSLKCRKKMKKKTPEVKWISIKRWITTTPSGIRLPSGVYYSIKRKEEYKTDPKPRFDKIEYVLLMFPYGNVWSMYGKEEHPITEDWMFSEQDGKLILEHLMMKDAACPVVDYFELCYKFMVENPDQIGIHLKRKRNEVVNSK